MSIRQKFVSWVWDVFRWFVGTWQRVILSLCLSVPVVLGVIGLNDHQVFNLTSEWNVQRTLQLFGLVFLGQFAASLADYIKNNPFPIPEDEE